MRNAAILACLCLLAQHGVAAQSAALDAGGAHDYRVVPGESDIRVLVFRAGALGRLGHNHVVTAKDVSGRVHVGQTPADSNFELTVPVQSLAVDAPEARSAEGSAFEGEPDADARAATRANMLGPKLLDGENYAAVHVRSTGISGSFDDMTVTAELEIRGERHTVELPVAARISGDRLVAAGSIRLTHAELGLEPFTAGFGTVRVADELTFRYSIVAEEETPGAEPSAGESALSVVEHDGVALAHRAAE
jgi:hypothetical protein